MQLVTMVEESGHLWQRAMLLGTVQTEHGSQAAEASRKFPDMWEQAQALKREMGVKADAVLLGN